MAISSNPSMTEVQNEFNNGQESNSLRNMLTQVFGSGNGSLRDFAGKGLPSITIGSVQSVTTDSATISFTVNSTGGLSCDYLFETYIPDPQFPSLWSGHGWQPVNGTGVDTFTITGLNDDTTYSARVSIRNAFGETSGGSSVSFTTDALEPYNLDLVFTRFDFTAEHTAQWSNSDSSTSIEYQENINNSGWSNTTTLSAGTTSYSSGVGTTDGNSVCFRVRYSGQTNWVSHCETSPGGTGGSCFVGGTMITTYRGNRVLIEELSVGDKLLAADIEGLEDTNNVNKLYSWAGSDVNKKDVSATIKEITEETMPSTVKVNDGLLEASNPHSQLIERGGVWKFLPIENIKVGDTLIDNNGDKTKVYSVEIIEEPTTVYKMTLEEPYHTFYANGILTHNIK